MMRVTRCITVATLAALFAPGVLTAAFGQGPMFQRVLTLDIKDPLLLDITLSKGDVNIRYSREGQVTISGFAKNSADKSAAEQFFKNGLVITQDKTHVTIRSAPNVPDSAVGIEIDVPYRTQVNSVVAGAGSQKLIGVTGPARLKSGEGDIDVTFVRLGPVEVQTGKGKISCTRTIQVSAETGEGNISLLENGPSKAVVKKGPGRIEVGGARGPVEAITDKGVLHIKAIPQGDWQLNSISGNIRIELPPKFNFEIAANSLSGSISIEREGMQQPEGNLHEFRQVVNGGGKHIQAHSVSGNITIE